MPFASPTGELALASAALIGIVLDSHVVGLALPTIKRQVDDEWMFRYRGWVYGLGWGLQLGTGLMTIVQGSAIYVFLMAALLSGSPYTGALLGACFGLVRGGINLATCHVRTPESLLAMDAWLRRHSRTEARAGMASMVLVATTLSLEVVL